MTAPDPPTADADAGSGGAGVGTGLALVGYRGTGKSTVGRIVARRLSLPFVDSDKEIERRAGKSIKAIFADDGEPAFRELEGAVVLDLCSRPDLVLATGGGAILRASNREALRRFGLVVWLTAPAEVLAGRLARDAREEGGRPALTAAGTLDEIGAVLEARFPLYADASDATVDTEGRSAARVAERVLELWSDRRVRLGRNDQAGPP